jgi:Fe-S-cluster-containing hydrogenase component 2
VVMLSRRGFLRSSGLTVFAVGPLTSLVGCSVRRAGDHPAYARAVILGDSALCVGCRRCELVCSSLHYPGLCWPEQALLHVDARAEERRFIDGHWFADACHECPGTLDAEGDEAPPPCVAACPTGAIFVAEGDDAAGRLRLRLVDEARCDNCGECISACPYGSLVSEPEREVVRVCDLCRDRPEGPACVAACPSTALRYYEPWRHGPARPFPWEAGSS